MTHQKVQIDPDTGEQKLVNSGFKMFFDDHLDLIMHMTTDNPTALKVFWWIIKFMDDRNALVVSQQAIGNALGLHKNTVYLAIKYLKDIKALTVLKSGSTSVFAVNAQIVWQSDADSKRYAHFDAKVYVAEFEQDEEYQKSLYAHAVKKPKKERPLRAKKTAE